MSKLRILVVDDEKVYTDTFVEYLRCAGYDAAAAYDVKNGVAKAGTFHPNLIFLDYVLPGGKGLKSKGGEEFLDQLQAISEHPIIIMVSASDLGFAEDRLKELGAEAVYQKPFPLSTVMEKIEQLSHVSGLSDPNKGSLKH